MAEFRFELEYAVYSHTGSLIGWVTLRDRWAARKPGDLFWVELFKTRLEAARSLLDE